MGLPFSEASGLCSKSASKGSAKKASGHSFPSRTLSTGLEARAPEFVSATLLLANATWHADARSEMLLRDQSGAGACRKTRLRIVRAESPPPPIAPPPPNPRKKSSTVSKGGPCFSNHKPAVQPPFYLLVYGSNRCLEKIQLNP